MSDYDGDYDDDGDDEDGRGQGSAGEEEFEDGNTQSQRTQSGGEESDGQSIEDGKNINHDKESHPGDKDQFDPRCETDQNYRRNESQLLDDKCKEFVYVDIPKPIMKNIVTPVKRVQEQMTKYYKKYIGEKWIEPNKPIELLNEFKRRNERYVSLLAKEFEMRKAAKTYSKSKLADTGDIDINKLATYKFDDNIFRKVMMTPKGKNHGLVLLLDRSGSMSKNMTGSIEQILVLAMFCRKVNIPFVVYGFTESSTVRALDIENDGMDANEFKRDYIYTTKYGSFTQNVGEMKFENVHLREYLNSRMSNAEFTGALKNMCLLMEGYKDRQGFLRPDSEQLNNTPMTQAIVATAEIMNEFKRSNNLDICSLIVVHDGDADRLNSYWSTEERINRETGLSETVKTPNWYYSHDRVYIMRDRSNKFEVKLSNPDYITKDVLNWFKKNTGARVFGFFIVSGRGEAKYVIREQFLNENGEDYWQIASKNGRECADEYGKKVLKEFKTEKFITSKLPGYENFFFIHGGEELTTEDEIGIEVEGKFTAKKLASAFAKYNKKRAVNRVLVSRFIQGIAA
jgi:hypothetical protein